MRIPVIVPDAAACVLAIYMHDHQYTHRHVTTCTCTRVDLCTRVAAAIYSALLHRYYQA
jgi:hypothetical protein